VVGDYHKPKVRLPGGGGAPEIATSCGEILITVKHSRRSLVDKIDFFTSFGFGEGGDHRERLGVTTKGPTKIMTDLCMMEPDPESREFVVTSIHPGVAREQLIEATGWPLCFAANVKETEPPSAEELEVLRDLHARTAMAHGAASKNGAA
jgi:glutaconate CoA-transferase subunit B